MSIWRARDEDGAGEPVDLVDEGDASGSEVAGGRDVDWHAVIRTGAAVVAALSLLWVGQSMADERADDERSSCLREVHEAHSRYEQLTYMRGWDGGEPTVERRIAEDLAERARTCGGPNADLYADAILYEPRPGD